MKYVYVDKQISSCEVNIIDIKY